MEKRKESVSVLFMFFSILFCVCLISANVLETKQIQVGTISLTGGLLVFPISYIIRPTSVPFGYLEKLIGRLRERFTFAPHAEIAIECNPASITEERLRALAEIGFTRVSYGIQDFSPDVLKIIGREPSLLPVKELLALSRDLHFKGINLDLIYGLPGQTESHFSESIEKAIDAHPDRIALYSYAHLPALKANQRALDKYPRPDARHKLELFLDARRRFMQAGFTFVGMDHFVDPEDSLARALSEGKLHRNFQGYCTRETTGQVYAFGASAISQLDNAYTQNVHESLAYSDLQLSHKLTELRCEPLSAETHILRDTSERPMCKRARCGTGLARDPLSGDAAGPLDPEPLEADVFTDDLIPCGPGFRCILSYKRRIGRALFPLRGKGRCPPWRTASRRSCSPDRKTLFRCSRSSGLPCLCPYRCCGRPGRAGPLFSSPRSRSRSS